MGVVFQFLIVIKNVSGFLDKNSERRSKMTKKMTLSILVFVFIAVSCRTAYDPVVTEDCNDPRNKITKCKRLIVKHKRQLKDTNMLCLGFYWKNETDKTIYNKGCNMSGEQAWDIKHTAKGGDGTHGYHHCAWAVISMVNSYYGGDLSIDRLCHFIQADGWNPTKEGVAGKGLQKLKPLEYIHNDLRHDQGGCPIWTKPKYYAGHLGWALGIGDRYEFVENRDNDMISYFDGKPEPGSVKKWINEGRPLIRYDNKHYTLISGYGEDDAGTMYIYLNDPGDKDPSTDLSVDPWKKYESLSINEFIIVCPMRDDVKSPFREERELYKDSDKDGIVDYDEIKRFKTDPLKTDSDRDGVPDKEEIRSYVFGKNGDYKLLIDEDGEFTFRHPDVDGDSLRAELDPDTDGDGINDGVEDFNLNGKYEYKRGELDSFFVDSVLKEGAVSSRYKDDIEYYRKWADNQHKDALSRELILKYREVCMIYNFKYPLSEQFSLFDFLKMIARVHIHADLYSRLSVEIGNSIKDLNIQDKTGLSDTQVSTSRKIHYDWAKTQRLHKLLQELYIKMDAFLDNHDNKDEISDYYAKSSMVINKSLERILR